MLRPRSSRPLRIGTAGWSIPAPLAGQFPGEGSHLERYGARLNCVEINSSFYRPHRRTTYERWADSTPDDFRFAVKLPRTITHEKRLQNHAALLTRFLDESQGLGEKLGVLLAQLPPSLAFDVSTASTFFGDLRRRCTAAIACEPRHPSWFGPDADAALARFKIARVAADPPRASQDGSPGGWRGLSYYRMHGSPEIYYSDYDDVRLAALARAFARQNGSHIWCIFDNTAAFAALRNARSLQAISNNGSRRVR